MKDLQFGGNMYIVLVYDISQSEAGQKRWSRIFKICKKYLSHIQNSVFEGEISKPQLMQLKKEMQPYINEELDSIIIFKSRQEKWMDKEGEIFFNHYHSRHLICF